MLADVGRMQCWQATGSDVGEPMAVPERIGCRCNGLEGGEVGVRDEGEMSVG